MSHLPALRVRAANDAPIRPEASFVLYWMIATRRTRFNFALDRAIDHARELNMPLVVLEALRVGYPWASDRLHRFVIDGMRDNAERFGNSPILYYPYVEPEPDHGKGLLEALAEHAAVVVTDEFPCFFLPRMVDAAARALRVRLDVVDSLGLMPLRAADRAYVRAVDFRRFLQKNLPAQLAFTPRIDPLSHLKLPEAPARVRKLCERWPPLDVFRTLDLSGLPIDHDVAPVPYDGGEKTARSELTSFLNGRLARYSSEQRHPDSNAASGLSPYLHFGHLSAHEILQRIAKQEEWTPADVSRRSSGQREKWWNLSSSAEAFLDELVTWRELSANFCAHRSDYDRYDSLPEWAQETLERHAGDRREHLYSLDELEAARTCDSIWNAAQQQLLREGRIHNYLRMLWGKKILEWSKSPQAALSAMVELNNKYAVDGRDPNSYSGIFWCLGRYDRAWGPERPIFGTVRYMSSDSTRKKLKLKEYLGRYADSGQTSGFSSVRTQ